MKSDRLRAVLAVLVAGNMSAMSAIAAASAGGTQTADATRPLLFGYLEVVVHSYEFKKGGDRVKDILFQFFGTAQILRLWQPGKYQGGKSNRRPETQLVELADPVSVTGLTVLNSAAQKPPKVSIKQLKTLPGFLFYTVDAVAGNWEVRYVDRGGPKGTNFYRIESNAEYDDFIKLLPGGSRIGLGDSRIAMTVPTSGLSFAGAYRVNESGTFTVTDKKAAKFQSPYAVEKLDEPSERALLAELVAMRDLSAWKTAVEERIATLGK